MPNVERRVSPRRITGTRRMKEDYLLDLGPPPWPWPVRMRYYASVFKQVIWYGDTSTIRVLLAASSFVFAFVLWLPLGTFHRKAFLLMAGAASEFWWGLAFFAHFAAVCWRFVALKPSVPWAFVVNAYGVMLWTVSTGLINESIGEFTPSNSMEVVAILLAVIALIRTGLNDEAITP